MIDRILWPTDFSENSRAALPLVKSMADKYNSRIYLLHVEETLSNTHKLLGMLGKKEVDKLEKTLMKAGETELIKVGDKDLINCNLYRKEVRVGDIAEEILKVADENDIGLIIMSTHGHGPIQNLAFGSVTEKVIKNSKTPVLAVPADIESQTE